MNPIKNYGYNILNNMLLGKIVQFISDCEFFPNFNVTGKVIEINLSGNIPLIKTILTSGKIINIDGGMSNLSFEVF